VPHIGSCRPYVELPRRGTQHSLSSALLNSVLLVLLSMCLLATYVVAACYELRAIIFGFVGAKL